MSVINRYVGAMAGAVSVVTAGAVLAQERDAAPDADARIAALEQQIAEIKAESRAWNYQDDEQLRALVQEVLADAETRTSMQRDGAYGGYDDGFYLASGDGTFRLNVGVLEQIRWVWNSRDGEVGPGFDTDRFGFENARTRLNFYGHVFGRETTYQVQGEFNRDGGDFTLLDAWIGHTYDNGWNFRVGQFRAPFLREELILPQHQLAVDRSYVNELTTGGRTQGIEGRYSQDTWRFNVMYSDGWGAMSGFNSEFSNTGFDTATTEYAFTGRFEWMIQGSDWDLFEDYTSPRDADPGMLFGLAGHYQEGEYGTVDPSPGTPGDPFDETEAFSWTADLQAEFGGSNLSGAVVGNHLSPNNDAFDSFDQYGFVVQGGFYVTDQWELFGRYEWFDFQGGDDVFEQIDEGAGDLSMVTVGFNYYIEGHNLKWTTDFVWGLDEIASGAPTIGILTDAAGEEDQMALRSQLQLWF